MEQHIKRSAVPHIMFIYNMHIQLYKHLQTQADGCILCASLLMPIITQQYDSAGGKGVTLDYRRKSQFLFKDSLCSDTTTPLLFSRAAIWRERTCPSFPGNLLQLFLTVCRKFSGTSRNTAPGWHRSWTCVKSYCTTAMPAPQRLGATPYSSRQEGWKGAGGISVPCPWKGGWSQWLLLS